MAGRDRAGRLGGDQAAWGQAREPGGWGDGWGKPRADRGGRDEAPAERPEAWAQPPAEPASWGEDAAGSPWGRQPDESPWARRAINPQHPDPWNGIEPVDENAVGAEPLNPQAPGGLVFRLRQEAAASENGAADDQQTKRKSLLGRLKG